MEIATYVHLGEKRVIQCEKSDAPKHPVVSGWLNGDWAKAAWVTNTVVAFSPVSVSTKEMRDQAFDLIASCCINQS